MELDVDHTEVTKAFPEDDGDVDEQAEGIDYPVGGSP